MRRLIVLAVLIMATGLAGYQIYRLSLQKGGIYGKFVELENKLNSINSENEKLEGDLKYYSNEANLEKEARSQLNYSKPGEKMIIIVPKKKEQQ